MSRLTTVLFDLDGTLIGMDQDYFIKVYFDAVIDELVKVAPGTRDEVSKGFYASVYGMLKNDGSITNEELFWRLVPEYLGLTRERFSSVADRFYENDFVPRVLDESCERLPLAREVIEFVHTLGLSCVLATNPVFPEVATRARVKFAGIAPESFKLITTYENSHFAKPRREYYEEILNSLGLCAEECVMVGNDTSDDLPAASLGMRVFILEHCLINKGNIDYSAVPHGGFAELMDFIRSLV